MYVSWGFFLVKINLLSILVHSWNIHFTLLLSSISETALIPNGSNYSVLLDSDRRLRDFEILEQWRMPGDTDSLSPDIAMYRWLALSVKETGKTLWLILSLFEDVFHSFDKICIADISHKHCKRRLQISNNIDICLRLWQYIVVHGGLFMV